jgi:hypothetical protein
VDRKSTYGYFWSTAESTKEVEYIETSDTRKEAVWLKKLVSGLFGDKLKITVVHYDNLVFHDRSKHIDMKYHYI